MYTGIVTDIGEIARSAETETGRSLWVKSAWDLDAIELGASIALSGVCFTLCEREGDRFRVDASRETLARTTVGAWRPGTRVNLERSLRLGDELGGHFVFGHVDGVGELAEIAPEGEGARFTIRAPVELAPYLAPKGSIAVDGASLTITDVCGARFSLALIPHSLQATTLGAAAVGAKLNLEADMLARYVRRMLEFGVGAPAGVHGA